MQPGEVIVASSIRDDLNRFAQMVWGQPRAISETHSQGFEYINLEGCLDGIRALFGRAVVQKILVRGEYRVATQELQTDVYRQGAYVTGQPGIGKSLLLVYLFVQLLGQQRKVAVHSPEHSFYVVFTDTVAFYPLTDPTPLSNGGPMYALSDSSGIEAPPPCFYRYDDVRLIQATSPKKSRWHEWSKQAMAECYVMDIWTEQEIANLANLLGCDVQRMVDLGKKWGGSPRTLLRYFAKSDQQIENWYRCRAKVAIRECQNTLQSIVDKSLAEDSESASRFYFCRPADYATSSIDRTETCATVPTHTICNILAEALKELGNGIQSEFFTALGQCNGTRESAEFIYRAWFHCFITTANKFLVCHWLYEKVGVTELYRPTDLASESAKELSSRKELPYYWPATTGYPGIDGALVCEKVIFVFQITIGSTHTSPEPGMRKLRDQLSSSDNLKKLPWRVVFVGNTESSSEAVARQWVGKVFLRDASKTPTPVAWSKVDPVAEDVIYRIIRDGDGSMEVVDC